MSIKKYTEKKYFKKIKSASYLDKNKGIFPLPMQFSSALTLAAALFLGTSSSLFYSELKYLIISLNFIPVLDCSLFSFSHTSLFYYTLSNQLF